MATLDPVLPCNFTYTTYLMLLTHNRLITDLLPTSRNQKGTKFHSLEPRLSIRNGTSHADITLFIRKKHPTYCDVEKLSLTLQSK